MGAQTLTTWRKHARDLLKEPKKLALLGGLVVVLAVLAGNRLFQGGAPAAASSAPTVRVPLSAPKAPTHSELASQAFGEWLSKHVSPVGRNLFVVRGDYFPRDTANVSPALREPSGKGFWDQLGKSLSSRADVDSKRKVLIENLRLQAQEKLKLQTTMVSQGKPKALINGKLVGEGDVVAEFRLVRIEARRIIVEREGIKLEVLFR